MQHRNTLAIKWKGITSLLHYFFINYWGLILRNVTTFTSSVSGQIRTLIWHIWALIGQDIKLIKGIHTSVLEFQSNFSKLVLNNFWRNNWILYFKRFSPNLMMDQDQGASQTTGLDTDQQLYQSNWIFVSFILACNVLFWNNKIIILRKISNE